MYCPNCGEPAGEGANFCGRCGLNLDPEREVFAGVQTVPAGDAATPDATRGDLPALGLSVAAADARTEGAVVDMASALEPPACLTPAALGFCPFTAYCPNLFRYSVDWMKALTISARR